MKVFVIANQKGGVGKTTTAANLGAALAEAGKRVLLIDLDPQANLSSTVGFDRAQDKQTVIESEEKPPYKSIYDVLVNSEKLASTYVATTTENLYLVPSHLSLAGAEVEMVNMMARETILHKALQEFHEKFDYVFIDCPPSLGLLTINALSSAHYILIPIQCEYFALEGLGQLMKTSELVKSINPSLQIGGAIMTMYDSRTKLSEQVVQEVKTHFDKIMFETIIPRNVRLSESPSHGKTVFQYDGKSTGAHAYKKLADEFIAKF